MSDDLMYWDLVCVAIHFSMSWDMMLCGVYIYVDPMFGILARLYYYLSLYLL